MDARRAQPTLRVAENSPVGEPWILPTAPSSQWYRIFTAPHDELRAGTAEFGHACPRCALSTAESAALRTPSQLRSPRGSVEARASRTCKSALVTMPSPS